MSPWIFFLKNGFVECLKKSWPPSFYSQSDPSEVTIHSYIFYLYGNIFYGAQKKYFSLQELMSIEWTEHLFLNSESSLFTLSTFLKLSRFSRKLQFTLTSIGRTICSHIDPYIQLHLSIPCYPKHWSAAVLRMPSLRELQMTDVSGISEGSILRQRALQILSIIYYTGMSYTDILFPPMSYLKNYLALI